MKHYLKVELMPQYDSRESEQVVKILFHHYLGWSATELLMRQDQNLSESEILLLHQALKKLKQGIPVQYVIGVAHFMGMDFRVTPAVLIPRPETEELVQLILDDRQHNHPVILDIGAGSGCIGLSLKKNWPESHVALLDTSAEALDIAANNAHLHGLQVEMIHADMLHYRSQPEQWDIIVSNPPYIPLSEKHQMDELVVRHEPHLALFVPDQSPLIFYERILQIARIGLKPKGKIYFELHENMAASALKLCGEYGYAKGRIYRDLQAKERMLVLEKSE